MGFSDICKLFARKMHFFLHYSPNIVLKSDFLHIIQQKKCIFRETELLLPREKSEAGSGTSHTPISALRLKKGIFARHRT